VWKEKKFAEQIAKKSGALLRQKFNKKLAIDYKGEINLVTEADKLSEDLIVSAIRRNFPSHGILAEESALIEGSSAIRWIIDPLDGTTNYAHGYPVFCVSIALEIEGIIEMGVIYDPMRDDMFSASRKDNTAYLNGEKLKVSRVETLSRSLLATGFPYDIRTSEDNNLDFFNALAVRAQAIRRAGAAALDLAYVAAGRFDGFWELKLMPWDTAAGFLMVELAGGKVSDFFGKGWNINSPHMAASNGLIHQQLIDALKRVKNK